jgi:hypothetical protein
VLLTFSEVWLLWEFFASSPSSVLIELTDACLFHETQARYPAMKVDARTRNTRIGHTIVSLSAAKPHFPVPRPKETIARLASIAVSYVVLSWLFSEGSYEYLSNQTTIL